VCLKKNINFKFVSKISIFFSKYCRGFWQENEWSVFYLDDATLKRKEKKDRKLFLFVQLIHLKIAVMEFDITLLELLALHRTYVYICI
jgi:hypothetical protein